MKIKRKKKSERVERSRRGYLGSLKTLCPNCNKPGRHFIPPSRGIEGFYICSSFKSL